MRKLLLIDRGDSRIRSFRKQLSGKGYEIVESGSISSALSAVRAGKADLIAIDSSMMDRVARSDRFRRAASSIPRIFICSDSAKRAEHILWEDNACVLYEPVSLDEFLSAADRLFRIMSTEEENRMLLDELIKRKEKFIYYEEITDIFNSMDDIDKSLQAALRKLAAAVDAKGCSLVFNDEILFQTLPIRPSRRINRYRVKQKKGITGWVIENGIADSVEDVTKDSRFDAYADSVSGSSIQSLACAPVKLRNRTIGVLRLSNKARGGVFSDDDLSMLIGTANHLAVAVERAFLYEKLKNDELTNLFNMRYLNHALEMEIERSRRYRYTFSVIFMDMDNFKKVNDRFGHLVGSRVLIEIAGILQKNLRRIDIISRYGGDEFVVILPQAGRESGFAVAERLRRTIERSIFMKREGYNIRLTASLGVASYPENAQSKEELLKLADKAMYHGKFLTKNTVFAVR
jgi:diguanylate cyclase (GGDEF)-like protein